MREREPDAVVVFIGANEGFPLPGPDGDEVDCCGPAVGGRVREPGAPDDEHLPPGRRRARLLADAADCPRDGDLAEVARAVNAAIAVAAQPFRAQVRVLDMNALFTPGGRYRDAMTSTGGARSCATPTAST